MVGRVKAPGISDRAGNVHSQGDAQLSTTKVVDAGRGTELRCRGTCQTTGCGCGRRPVNIDGRLSFGKEGAIRGDALQFMQERARRELIRNALAAPTQEQDSAGKQARIIDAGRRPRRGFRDSQD